MPAIDATSRRGTRVYRIVDAIVNTAFGPGAPHTYPVRIGSICSGQGSPFGSNADQRDRFIVQDHRKGLLYAQAFRIRSLYGNGCVGLSILPLVINGQDIFIQRDLEIGVGIACYLVGEVFISAIIIKELVQIEIGQRTTGQNFHIGDFLLYGGLASLHVEIIPGALHFF